MVRPFCQAIRLLGPALVLLGCGRTYNNKCDPAARNLDCNTAVTAPDGGDDGPSDGANNRPVIVADFERGLGTQPPEGRSCMAAAGFDPANPADGGGSPCAWVGLTPRSCQPEIVCEGCQNSVLCPQYIHRGDPGALLADDDGDFALRLFYWLDGTTTCMGGRVTDSFSLVVFWLSNGGTSSRCQGANQPLNISGYESLQMNVRLGDALGNLEVGLQQERDSTAASADPTPETFPKPLLLEAGQARAGQWLEAKVSVCDLLKQGDAVKLDPTRITAVMVGFAREHFMTSGFYSPGTRGVDVDNIKFLPCPSSGCKPCP